MQGKRGSPPLAQRRDAPLSRAVFQIVFVLMFRHFCSVCLNFRGIFPAEKECAASFVKAAQF
jgi:hypothetical protein